MQVALITRAYADFCAVGAVRPDRTYSYNRFIVEHGDLTFAEEVAAENQ